MHHVIRTNPFTQIRRQKRRGGVVDVGEASRYGTLTRQAMEFSERLR